ncbi:MAG TPA: hypothetical protein PLF21_05450, partial [Exilispira sp.]|nr:hypothetical protein [Exilispira sp.]
MNEELTFTLTGNFQYDLGILGLKKILDFFVIKYESDGKFYISIDRDKGKILEDIIAKLMFDNGINYFWDKVRSDKELNSQIENLGITLTDEIRTYDTKRGLESIVEEIYNKIELRIPQDINNREELLMKIQSKIWQKGVNLLNNILLNFQPDMKVTGKDVLTKAKEKLVKDVIPGKRCSFCNQRDGKRLTRDVFFFAPAQFNVSWFNEPNLFICPECLV